MRPLFQKFHQILENKACTRFPRPLLAIAITFGSVFILCEASGFSSFEEWPAGYQRGKLPEVLTVAALLALWLTVIVAGYIFLPLRMRRAIIFSLLPLQSATLAGLAIILAIFFLAPSSFVFAILPLFSALQYLAEVILIVLTIVSLWAWSRYFRGKAID
jgi:hypothetical protein